MKIVKEEKVKMFTDWNKFAEGVPIKCHVCRKVIKDEPIRIKDEHFVELCSRRCAIDHLNWRIKCMEEKIKGFKNFRRALCGREKRGDIKEGRTE